MTAQIFFIDTASGEYPVTLAQIRAAHPLTVFPEPFNEAFAVFAPVAAVAQPEHNAATHKAVELQPVEASGGWAQAWMVVPLAADDIAQVRAGLLAALNAEYERRMQVIAGGYPLSERESWHVQTAEARALIADVHALTPWINGAAAARQIDRLVLAQRIAAKDDQYRAIHGALTGARQRIEDQIDTAGEDAQALQLIDVLAGWPGQEENQ
ncbi:hypothetical protein [Acidovorax radicis]|uniref:hypothetical protein n=1 Tax=Acidovorax radicis TaxID=758826 RepID=UPI00023766CB|nr:hypothetical protein [Acidovorax radicis]